jgi:hypothetical protein
MITDGTTNPAGVYVEQEYSGKPNVGQPYRVQHGGELYSGLSPLKQIAVARKTANDKFTEVIVNGETVYTESHPNRSPNT